MTTYYCVAIFHSIFHGCSDMIAVNSRLKEPLVLGHDLMALARLIRSKSPNNDCYTDIFLASRNLIITLFSSHLMGLKELPCLSLSIL